jgi:hypothetical protein
VILRKYGDAIICVGDMSSIDAGPGQGPMPRVLGLLRTLKNMKYKSSVNQIVTNTTSNTKQQESNEANDSTIPLRKQLMNDPKEKKAKKQMKSKSII